MKDDVRDFKFKLGDKDAIVSGIFQKGSPMVRYYADGSGYPGDPDTFEIEKLIIDGEEIDIDTLFNDEKKYEYMEEEVLKALAEDDENKIIEDIRQFRRTNKCSDQKCEKCKEYEVCWVMNI